MAPYGAWACRSPASGRCWAGLLPRILREPADLDAQGIAPCADDPPAAQVPAHCLDRCWSTLASTYPGEMGLPYPQALANMTYLAKYTSAQDPMLGPSVRVAGFACCSSACWAPAGQLYPALGLAPVGAPAFYQQQLVLRRADVRHHVRSEYMSNINPDFSSEIMSVVTPSVLWMSRQWNPPGQAHSLVQRLLPLMRLGVGDALRRPSPASAGKGWSWGLDRQPLDPSRSRPAAGARCSSVIRCPNATQ